MAYSICFSNITSLFSKSTPRLAFIPAVSSRICSREAHTSSPNDSRLQLLKEIYAPFSGLEKDSEKYNELAESGKCWSDYFKPGDMSRYKELEREYSSLLREIDSYRNAISSQKRAELTRSLVPEYAQQSVSIKNNPLKLNHAHQIATSLSSLFKPTNFLSDFPPSSLLTLPLPSPHSLIPTRPASQVSELRNHILASYWSASTSSSSSSSTRQDITELQTRTLTTLLLKDTSEHSHAHPDPGTYRKIPIKVKSNPLRIFPYPREIPRLMEEFFFWRDTSASPSANTHSAYNTLHPLLLSCKMVLYFLSIHPFPDGNGRVSRVLMQDYLVRRGYLPVLGTGMLDGEEYAGLVSEGLDGRPDVFVGRVLEGQLEVMKDAVA